MLRKQTFWGGVHPAGRKELSSGAPLEDCPPPPDIRRADGSSTQTEVRCRIDTPIEVDYYRHGGILPFVLRQILTQ